MVNSERDWPVTSARTYLLLVALANEREHGAATTQRVDRETQGVTSREVFPPVNVGYNTLPCKLFD